MLLSFGVRDVEAGARVARRLADAGTTVHATPETRAALGRIGVAVTTTSGGAHEPAARVRAAEFSLVVSTPRDGEASREIVATRRAAIWAGVPCITTVEAAAAAVAALEGPERAFEVRSLQRWEARARC